MLNLNLRLETLHTLAIYIFYILMSNRVVGLTLIVELFHGSFPCVLSSFEYHFNSLLLTFITEVCSEIPCSIVSRFAKTSYLHFNEIQPTGCHMMRDPVWESRNRLLTVLYFFFFCLLVVYFYIAPSRVSFEYVSYKLFR